MCHPFHQIIADSQSQAVATGAASQESSTLGIHSRRGWLATLLAAATAAVATWRGKSAHALQQESYAAPPGMMTTQALGEEGGSGFSPSNPPSGPVTTFALGEEGSGYYYRRRPNYYYRRVPPPPGRVTTYALGEEGAGY